MLDYTDLSILLGVMLVLVFTGVHVAISLGVTAVLGLFLMSGDMETARTFVANTAYEALRDYIFAVIPLFMLMGEFLAKCGAARDMFALVDRLSRWLPGRLGVATVLANGIFAFVSGVSIAAAAAFSRIAYPEMKRAGYHPQFAVGCIAGSAVLGMLIPPSVLMIVWGVLTETSIGGLFLAGVLPGLLLITYYIAYILYTAVRHPEVVGEARSAAEPVLNGNGTLSAGGGLGVGPVRLRTAEHLPDSDEVSSSQALGGTMLVIALVVGVLTGIWAGAFTPTEGAGVGAVAALLLAMARGLRTKEIGEVVVLVARTSGPLLLLLFTAQLYSRTLAMTGVTQMVQDFMLSTGLGPFEILALMVLTWFILGCLIDSISIILLTAPVFYPIAIALGFEPLAFAIIAILAIETGLLTPPFGILAFTVRSALASEGVSIGTIFRGAVPYWMALLAAIVTVAIFPAVATWLPKTVFGS
jgi:C4-dicarboxylate transporter, DctM subunit